MVRGSGCCWRSVESEGGEHRRGMQSAVESHRQKCSNRRQSIRFVLPSLASARGPIDNHYSASTPTPFCSSPTAVSEFDSEPPHALCSVFARSAQLFLFLSSLKWRLEFMSAICLPMCDLARLRISSTATTLCASTQRPDSRSLRWRHLATLKMRCTTWMEFDSTDDD